MTFHRSSSGLANQPIFHDAALVVYVEGALAGKAALALPEGECQSQDAIYWQQVIAAICGDTRAHFKALGSKTNLLGLASALDYKARGKVLVCVDRDYDDFREGLVTFNCLVRTFSYSWESDVWSLPVVRAIVGDLLPIARLPEAAESHCNLVWGQFYARASRFVAIDAKLVIGSVGASLFRRDAPAAAVCVGKESPPSLNIAFFSRQFAAIRPLLAKPWRFDLCTAVIAQRHLFGKSAMVFGYHLLKTTQT